MVLHELQFQNFTLQGDARQLCKVEFAADGYIRIHMEREADGDIRVDVRQTESDEWVRFQTTQVAVPANRNFGFMLPSPLQIRIISSSAVVKAHYTQTQSASATEQAINNLQESVATLTGENDTTPDIDTMREVKDFLAGMKQGDTIQQAINDSHADLSEEQMDDIKNLFPTK